MTATKLFEKLNIRYFDQKKLLLHLQLVLIVCMRLVLKRILQSVQKLPIYRFSQVLQS